jgi:hypothetical protein
MMVRTSPAAASPGKGWLIDETRHLVDHMRLTCGVLSDPVLGGTGGDAGVFRDDGSRTDTTFTLE